MAYLELQMTHDRCGWDRDKIADCFGGGGPPRVDDNEIASDLRVRARGEEPAGVFALDLNERVSREYAKYRRPVRLCLGGFVVGLVLFFVMYYLFYVPGRLRCDAGAVCGTNVTRQALDGCCNFFCCSQHDSESRELPARPYSRWDDWLNATGPACAIYEQPDELRRKDAYYWCDNCAEEEWRCSTFYEGRASHYEVTWPLAFLIPFLGPVIGLIVLPQLKIGKLQRLYAEAFADWLARGIITHVHVVRGWPLKPNALRLYFERPPEGYPRMISRGDFAVGGFWLASLLVFIAGQQQRLNLPLRDKHQADPLFYTGIVLIAIATPVLLCYLVVRVSRASAAARVAAPATDESDPDEWVSLLPGGMLTFKGKRERPGARFWSTMVLRLGTPTLFLTPCVDVGLTADVCGGDGAFVPFAAPTPVVGLSCYAALWLLVKVFVNGSHARSSYGATYLDLHLGCVSLAALTLALSIVLCLTLGPPVARRVAHSEYDDDEELDKQGTDAHLFYNAAAYRCVLLAFVLATLFCSSRLRCAAGKPPPGDAVELGPRGENPMSAPAQPRAAPSGEGIERSKSGGHWLVTTGGANPMNLLVPVGKY